MNPTPPTIDAPERRALERANSYSDAFYELGKLMGIPAPQSKSPSEVWATQMRPRLKALLNSEGMKVARSFATQAEPDSWLAYPVTETDPIDAPERRAPSILTHDQMKKLWQKHGGRQHGPRVEQYFIEEMAFYRFARDLCETTLAMQPEILLAASSGERSADLELALNVALGWLAPMEPGDSRAVSDEFVAMASIQADCANQECRDILHRALAALATPATAEEGEV